MAWFQRCLELILDEYIPIFQERFANLAVFLGVEHLPNISIRWSLRSCATGAYIIHLVSTTHAVPSTDKSIIHK